MSRALDLYPDLADEIEAWFKAVEARVGIERRNADPDTPAAQAHAVLRRTLHEVRCRAQMKLALAKGRLEVARSTTEGR